MKLRRFRGSRLLWSRPVDTFAYHVPVGSATIDLVDARKKDLVWRSTASDATRSGKSNEEQRERLVQIVAQMFAGYTAAPATK